MKVKRIVAFCLDLFFVYIISSFIFILIFSNSKATEYEKLLNEYSDIVLKSTSGSSDIDEEELLDITYEMQVATKPLLIIRIGVLILYFGVLAYLLKGQTLGKKILKLQVVPNKGSTLNPGLFILRSVIITNLVFETISLILLIYCSKNTYFEYNSLIANLGDLLYIIIIGCIILRDDERGLHDLICNTKVISTKKQSENSL